MLLVANFFWGLSFPLIKAITQTHAMLQPQADGWFITAMTIAPRFVLGALAVGAWLGWLAWRRPGGESMAPRRSEWMQGVGLALFASGGMLFQNDGLQYTKASTSAFLTQLYAVLIPLWVALRARRGPRSVVWWAMVLVVLGGGVLAEFDPRELHLGRGEAETLLSSLFFMGQILLLGRADYFSNRPLVVTLVMFAGEAVVFVALAVAWAPEPAMLLAPWRSAPWVWFTVLVTVFCTLAAFILMNTYQPRITPTEAGLIYCIEPIFGAALALFLPAWFSAWAGICYANETMTWTLILGGGLITAANVLVQLRPGPAPAAPG